MNHQERSPVYAVFSTGVLAGVRGGVRQWPKCEPQVEFIFERNGVSGWQVWVNETSVFSDRDAAEQEWVRRHSQ